MLSLKHKDVFIYNDALVPKARITTVLELNLEKLMDEQITATSNVPIIAIEVQIGEITEESDIVRLG